MRQDVQSISTIAPSTAIAIGAVILLTVALLSGCEWFALGSPIMSADDAAIAGGPTPTDPTDGAGGEGTSDEVYTVTYDANGADGGSVPADQTKTAGIDLTLAENNGGLYKVNHVFSGWTDGAGTNYAAGGRYTDDADVTLYAVWVESGIAQWARTTVVAGTGTFFNAAAAAVDGTVYAVGSAQASGTVDLGSGVGASVSGPTENALIVNYGANGAPLWAITPSTTPSVGEFNDVAVDQSGNVYAVGYQSGTGTYTYAGATAAGTCTSSNAVIVKFDSSGNGVWAQTTTSGSDYSQFEGVAVGPGGVIYAVGRKFGSDPLGFGGGVTVTGWYGAGDDPIIVAFDPSGTALWAGSVTSGYSNAQFYDVTTDVAGNAYAVGTLSGKGVAYTFGGTASASTGVTAGFGNGVVVQYAVSGTAQWARTIADSSDNNSEYRAVAGGDGCVYVGGYFAGSGPFSVDGGLSVTPTNTATGRSVVIKYDDAGAGQWMRIQDGGDNSRYTGVGVHRSGDVYAVGYQESVATYNYGSGVSVNGADPGYNTAIVRYSSAGLPLWARSTEIASSPTGFNGVAIADSAVYGVGYQTGETSVRYGPGVEATAGSSGVNILVVAYSR